MFGKDCKEANDALKSLLTVFLERKVHHVVVKNPRLDLLVEFDDRTMVDLEMQLRQTKDNLPIRFSYYLARLHGSQELEGKILWRVKGNGFSLEQICAYCSLNVDEIQVLIKS